MSELNPEIPNQPEESWNLYRENVTREMLHETGFGKTIAERYDEQFGPENWEWRPDNADPIEQAERAMDSAVSKLAREGLSNLMATGDFVTHDGTSARGLENRSAAPVFGSIYIKHQKVE